MQSLSFGPQSYAGKHPNHPSHMVTKRLFISGILAASILGGIIGAILGHLATGARRNSSGQNQNGSGGHVPNRSHRNISNVNPSHVRDVFRNITSSSRPAGSTESQKLAEFLASQWKQYGLEEIELTSYKKTLWLPESTPNKITYTNMQGKQSNFLVIHRPLESQEEQDPNVYHPFAAHSAAVVSEGKLIYANYGRNQDFAWLLNQNIMVKDSIVIVRTGKISTGAIVLNAERHGAKGVILYCDPAECATEGRENVYPDRLWLPSTGVKSETCRIAPEDISLDDSFHVNIPVQPISYDNAEQLLKTLTDVEPPSDWKGNLESIGYRVMSKNTDRKVTMEVKTRATNVTIQNVFGIIKGSEEHDRYVLVGSRRDSWTFGGFGSASGSASLLEITKVFGEMLQKGWRPLRTLVFCSWGGGEYNSLGSAQWARENYLNLRQKAVAYINLDALVQGHHSLIAHGSYLLHNLIRDASRKISNPDQNEIDANRKTLFDTWWHNTCCNATSPQVHLTGLDSDSVTFINFLGVPSLEFYYTDDNSMHRALKHPLRSSLYDTFHAVNILDPKFMYHAAMVQLVCEVVSSLAESTILPLDVHEFAMSMKKEFWDFQDAFKSVISKYGISLDAMSNAVENFTEAAHSFQHRVKASNLKSPITVRMINDQLMSVEKAFLSNKIANVASNFFRNVLYAPSTSRDYEITTFSAIIDAATKGTGFAPEQKDNIMKQIAIISNCFDTASAVLNSKWL